MIKSPTPGIFQGHHGRHHAYACGWEGMEDDEDTPWHHGSQNAAAYAEACKPRQEDLDAYFLSGLHSWTEGNFCISNGFMPDSAIADRRTLQFILVINRKLSEVPFWYNKYDLVRPYVLCGLAPVWSKESPWLRHVDIKQYRRLTENEFKRMIEPDNVLIQDFIQQTTKSLKSGELKIPF